MTDVGSHHFVKGGSGVLVPQPSADPHDPLNWSTKWKVMAIIASTSVSFTQGFGPLALAPAFGFYIEAFHCTLEQAIQFTGVSILVLGFSNFIWVPLSTSFGRRGVYITSQLICLGSMIWRARAQTYGSFMGACILNGIGAGPAESIQPAVIADIFFLHDVSAFLVGQQVSTCRLTQSSAWHVEHSLLDSLHGFVDGCTHHFRPNECPRWLAQLLVAQCRLGHPFASHGCLHVP